MVLSVGRGNSSRRALDKQPTTLAQRAEAAPLIRRLAGGQAVDDHGQPLQLAWATGELPVWVAGSGYGPKALWLAGSIADGVILQFADPHLIRWCIDFVREGAAAAGRDPASIQIMATAPVWVSDDVDAARGCAGSPLSSRTMCWTSSRGMTRRNCHPS
jgi:alkanesulfonate monooxygenase SsuD/methylene tetrahydromethanopterin reductase-like flavin-dependent oxidoreductase (luciferase family)